MVVALGTHYDLGVLQSRLHETWARARGIHDSRAISLHELHGLRDVPLPAPGGRRVRARRPPETEPARRLAAAAGAFDEVRAATCRREGVGLTRIDNQLKAEEGVPAALWGAYEAMNDAADACYGFPPVPCRSANWPRDRQTDRSSGDEA